MTITIGFTLHEYGMVAMHHLSGIVFCCVLVDAVKEYRALNNFLTHPTSSHRENGYSQTFFTSIYCVFGILSVVTRIKTRRKREKKYSIATIIHLHSARD